MHVWKELTARREFRWPDTHRLHSFVHAGEGWAHRTYLLLVSVEVKYWYGKAAVAILLLELAAVFLHEEE